MRALALAAILLCSTPVYPQKWGLNLDQQICLTDGCLVAEESIAEARRAGFSTIRWVIYFDKVNPEPGLYRWEYPDRQYAILQKYGIEIYANIQWAPAWASDGKPAYEAFTAGCSDWVTPGDPTKLKFREVDYCIDPPSIDREAWSSFVREAVRRYPGVRYWGLWNEPNYRTSYPPRPTVDGFVDVGKTDFDRFVREVQIPGYDAVKSANPGALVVGPETDDAGNLYTFLWWEQNKAQRPLFDIVSFHAYSWRDNYYPQGALERTFQHFVQPSMLALIGPRQIWITETRPMPPTGQPPETGNLGLEGQQTRDFAEAIKADGRVSRVYFYRIGHGYHLWQYPLSQWIRGQYPRRRGVPRPTAQPIEAPPEITPEKETP